jgi:hypothetical protein
MCRVLYRRGDAGPVSTLAINSSLNQPLYSLFDQFPLTELKLSLPSTCSVSEETTTSYRDKSSSPLAQLNPLPLADQFPELDNLASGPPPTSATLAGTYSSKIVPFANDAHKYVINTDDSVAGSQGNAVAVAVKNVTVSDTAELLSETASKYHQSKTEELIVVSWGASRVRRDSVVRVVFGVGMVNRAWAGLFCTKLGMV